MFSTLCCLCTQKEKIREEILEVEDLKAMHDTLVSKANYCDTRSGIFFFGASAFSNKPEKQFLVLSTKML